MKPIQITIRTLKQIIEDAEMMRKYDASLSDTIELSSLRECDTHTGSDLIAANLKSNYAECNSSLICGIDDHAARINPRDILRDNIWVNARDEARRNMIDEANKEVGKIL